MKLAVVGATGMVGMEILKVLEERAFPVSELLAVASERSTGKTVSFKGKEIPVISLFDAVAAGPDIALFSAGSKVSLEWAPKFAEKGTVVIDNSSAWRMEQDIKLVVPEVNAGVLTNADKIIANPNCSTIQLVVVLAPLHKKYRIKRLVVSTYQSVSGTGIKAVRQFEDELKGIDGEKAYPHDIAHNCLPHCDCFLENDYTREEMKMVQETQKILQDESLRITTTAVRVPVTGGHSESVNIEFENDFDIDDIPKMLSAAPGIIVQDDVRNNIYPMPKYTRGKDETFVGRIRRDYSQPNSLNLWIVADNLRKGAATNAVQIAECIIDK